MKPNNYGSDRIWNTAPMPFQFYFNEEKTGRSSAPGAGSMKLKEAREEIPTPGA